ncbi:hypothetical protein [Pseudochrobactrum asaccharolyticum]|uniref:Uncharacterized protein n=1 Tax=Pseudochrobactrum asaccharolyticum TaxID=354351 RepID=A0A366DTR6_9HYPH|nr:hypothetical protein [Pseudochrobactrum asaccharolyticum]RBO93482.1 hypothetical protein DFR47_105201 [Pseudochrobactrum asaccharolyticum]
MFDLPRPEQIIEELADKVGVQIDRDAPVAFDSALREMTRYHRFLLHLGASKTTDGSPFNLAEIAGDAWSPPHQEWNKQYIRLFERAANKLEDNDYYIRSLSYAPSRILPRRDGQKFSQNTLISIADMFPAFVHRLEAWVTKHSLQTISSLSSSVGRGLSGSTAKSYESVLPVLVGSSESWLHSIVWLFDWEGDPAGEKSDTWVRYKESWPVLWRHLQNTAYCLAVAVWNDDRLGADYFRDALVKWRQELSYNLDSRSELRWHRLLLPDVMTLNWVDASKKAAALGYEYDPEPSPATVFSNVVHQSYDDVLNLTAATFLFWSINKKVKSDLATQTAQLLLERKVLDGEAMRPSYREVNFRHLLLDVLRIEMAGYRFQDGTYGAELDKLVSRLDSMTERTVVSGRVFTPSTIHGREELRPAIVAMLVAWLPQEPDAVLGESINALASKVALLPDEDGSLRSILHEIKNLRTLLESPNDNFINFVANLTTKQSPASAVIHLAEELKKIEQLISEARAQRLKSIAVDQSKINILRDNVESKLLQLPANIQFFSKFTIDTETLLNPDNIFTARLDNVKKGQFVTPAMEQESINFGNVLSSNVSSIAANRIWRLFTMRPRISIEISENLEDKAFWQKAVPYIAEVGPNPVLIVSIAAEAKSFQRFMYSDAKGRSELRIERQQKTSAEGHFIANVEGVDVFCANFEAGVAWLFSSEALRCVTYAEVDESKHFIEASFEEDDSKNGSLAFSFYQRAEWADLPIFEIKMNNSVIE